MLNTLYIENIAVAKKLSIEFPEGFVVLTGETGAGKSIIIDSVNLLLGGKVSRDLIRSGEEKATVSATFTSPDPSVTDVLKEEGIEPEDDTLFLSRTVTAEGKSTFRLNGRAVSTTLVRQIAPDLIRIHGQNDSQTFMQKSGQLRLLDAYAGTADALVDYRDAYQKLRDCEKSISELEKLERDRTTMVDVYRFQVAEINGAKLNDENEEEKLEILRSKLKNAERVTKHASLVYRALYENDKNISAVNMIDRAIDAIGKISDIVADSEEITSKLLDYRSEIQDIAERVYAEAEIDGIDDPAAELDRIEMRLSQIHRLRRKYGATVADVLKFRDDAQEKLDKLESAAETLADLENDRKRLFRNAEALAFGIRKTRTEAAERLSREVSEVLTFLDMPKVRFNILISALPVGTLNENGADDVTFMIATNPGEPLGPMSGIASGGELSRIMLALKSAVREKNLGSSMIFDEIDTGISGSTSRRVGLKLKSIARDAQTICVTHSAQIASLADCHLFVHKTEVDGRAQSAVSLLTEEERVSEIARIIGGIEITQTQLEAAREMIEEGRRLSV